MDAQAVAIAVASLVTPLVVWLGVFLVGKLARYQIPGDQAAFGFSWLMTFAVATLAYFVAGGRVHGLADVFEVGSKVFAISQPIFWLLYKPLRAALGVGVDTVAKGVGIMVLITVGASGLYLLIVALLL